MLAALIVALPGVPERSFDPAALDALPQVEAVSTFHGMTLRCTGPRLDVVLAAAGMPAGEALRGAALRQVALARGADGYVVGFTPAELDPLLGNRAVVVTARCGGKALDASDGPLRLLVDGDRRGARSVRQLTRIEVVTLPDRP